MTNSIEKTEQIPYSPHLNSIEELIKGKEKLTPRQVMLEIARLKYALGQGTNELIAQLDKFDQQTKNYFKRQISIVALSDIPDIEDLLRDENKEDLIDTVNFVLEFKNKIEK